MSLRTPRTVDATVRRVCRDICDASPPVLVPVCPADGAVADDCFLNVRRCVEQAGGQEVVGWLVMLWPRVLAEAVHHAVWRAPEGALVDVTPQPSSLGDRGLFVEDPPNGTLTSSAACRRARSPRRS